MQRKMHRLCKLDEWCTLIQLEKLEKENEENIEKLKEGIYFIDILNLDGSSIGIKQLVKN